MKLNRIILLLNLFLLASLCHAQFFIDEVRDLEEKERMEFSKAVEGIGEGEHWLGANSVMYGRFSAPEHREAIVQRGSSVHGVSDNILLGWEKSSWQPVYLNRKPIVGGFLSDPFFPGGCRNFSTLDKRDIPVCAFYDWGGFTTNEGTRTIQETIAIWYSDISTNNRNTVFILRSFLDGLFECSSLGLVYHDLYSFYPKDLGVDGDDDLVVELLRYTLTQQEPCSSDAYPVIGAFPFRMELQTLAWLQDESQFVPTEETKLFLQTYDEELF